MNRIQQLFRQKTGDILNIYFTAGFPGLHDTTRLILALEKAGADLVEVGIPYSDPLADGPTIQASSQSALKNGMTLSLLFHQVREARQQTNIPVILMGYLNQILQYGEQRFLEQCVAAGVDGLIIPDLPLDEYERHYRKMIEQSGLCISFLITPQTSIERIRQIDDLNNGFIYMVADSATTGSKGHIHPQQLAYFERIQQMNLNKPRMIGFGIHHHESFVTACQYAQGAIIGSAFIRAIEDATDLEETTFEFIERIRNRLPPLTQERNKKKTV